MATVVLRSQMLWLHPDSLMLGPCWRLETTLWDEHPKSAEADFLPSSSTLTGMYTSTLLVLLYKHANYIQEKEEPNALHAGIRVNASQLHRSSKESKARSGPIFPTPWGREPCAALLSWGVPHILCVCVEGFASTCTAKETSLLLHRKNKYILASTLEDDTSSGDKSNGSLQWRKSKRMRKTVQLLHFFQDKMKEMVTTHALPTHPRHQRRPHAPNHKPALSCYQEQDSLEKSPVW